MMIKCPILTGMWTFFISLADYLIDPYTKDDAYASIFALTNCWCHFHVFVRDQYDFLVHSPLFCGISEIHHPGHRVAETLRHHPGRHFNELDFLQ